MKFNLLNTQLPKAVVEGKSFDLSKIDFTTGWNKDQLYIPEELTHLYYTDSYSLFSDEDKLTYNHMTAYALCEQYVFLEDYLLIPVIEGVLKSKQYLMKDDLRTYLKRFIDEEKKHSEMFWSVLENVNPESYKDRKLKISKPSFFREQSLALFNKFPAHLLGWMWMALLFEERTIEISRRHKKDKNIAKIFSDVHFYHMVEEAQHVALDELLITEVYAKASPWVRKLAAKTFYAIMNKYAAPRVIPNAALNEVFKNNPKLMQHYDVFQKDIRGLKHNQEYQMNFYSRASFPKTFAYMDRFPEMKILSEAMPGYQMKPSLNLIPLNSKPKAII